MGFLFLKHHQVIHGADVQQLKCAKPSLQMVCVMRNALVPSAWKMASTALSPKNPASNNLIIYVQYIKKYSYWSTCISIQKSGSKTMNCYFISYAIKYLASEERSLDWPSQTVATRRCVRKVNKLINEKNQPKLKLHRIKKKKSLGGGLLDSTAHHTYKWFTKL